jgi:isocitrate/isopropylmalate dehydrogenase
MSIGKGLANPTALLLSSIMMLRFVRCPNPVDLFNQNRTHRHMSLNEYADKIERAALTVRCTYRRKATRN